MLAAAICVAAGSSVAGAAFGTGRSLLPSSAPPGGPAVSQLQPPDGSLAGSDGTVARLTDAIAVWSANLRRDPQDFVSATNLGFVSYNRARLTGSIDDYARAKEATERALAVYPVFGPARSLRATVLYATHDFAAALAEATALYTSDANQAQALATIGDAQLELGDYDAARAAYDKLAVLGAGAALTARFAHVAFLGGNAARAQDLAERAISEARSEGASGAAFAWYEYFAGEIAFQEGDVTASDRHDRRALAAQPDSFLALGGLARAEAAEGRFGDAIASYERAVAIVPRPEMLAALGDLYLLTERPADALRQYDTVRFVAQLGVLEQQVYNRQLVLFDVDHGVHPDEALRLAAAELAVRKDVYGYDAYAWALFGAGRYEEAAAAMWQAMRLGTVDAKLLYHAGMIEVARRHDAAGRSLLQRALALNAGFDPLQAARARAVLAGSPPSSSLPAATP